MLTYDDDDGADDDCDISGYGDCGGCGGGGCSDNVAESVWC
jgi:hypothetical protein